MSRLSSAFVLGYHGCPVSVAEKVLRNQPFKASSNDYDWLGPGVYFWEANPRRGLEYFRHLSERKRLVEEGVVVGAIIDLGYCLDLTSSMGVIAVRAAYESYLAFSTAAGSEVPRNRLGDDMLLRKLDCAVIRHLHHIRREGGYRPYQTVRALFREGAPLYPNSGFYEKSHLQIAVVDASCIKGVFRVPQEHLDDLSR